MFGLIFRFFSPLAGILSTFYKACLGIFNIFIKSPASSTQRCSKRALLIASSFGQLQGPENDVETVAQLLGQNGFATKLCRGSHATRSGILKAWHKFNSDIQNDDIIFVYYSGHGGLFEPVAGDAQGRRYQFLVPMDYRFDEANFNGILDMEISVLLHQITTKTKNVTAVFDCCHSGRIARNPLYGSNAVSKDVSSPSQQALHSHLKRLHESMQLDLSNVASVEGNPDVVRIVACADLETAWEYKNDQSEHCGVVTEALVAVLGRTLSSDTDLTWRNVMMRVSELVATRFPDQHPHVEGPDNRVLFSLKTKSFTAIPVRVEGDEVVLKAGRIAGVREKNQYIIMPPGSSEALKSQMIGTGSVSTTTDFESCLNIDSGIDMKRIAETGTCAYPTKEYHCPFPITVSEDLKAHPRLRDCHLIRPISLDQNEIPFAHIHTTEEAIILSNASQQVCASFNIGQFGREEAVEKAIQQAECMSRAGHLLNLKASGAESLDDKVKVTFRSVSRGENLALDGTTDITSGDRIALELENESHETVYVSVFSVNVAGKVSLVSAGSPMGITLRPEGPQKRYVLGQLQHGLTIKGLEMTWPKNLPAIPQQFVPEYLVCIVTSASVDLRCLESYSRGGGLRGDPSQLEKLAYELSYGQGRDCAIEGIPVIRWDLISIPFRLHYR